MHTRLGRYVVVTSAVVTPQCSRRNPRGSIGHSHSSAPRFQPVHCGTAQPKRLPVARVFGRSRTPNRVRTSSRCEIVLLCSQNYTQSSPRSFLALESTLTTTTTTRLTPCRCRCRCSLLLLGIRVDIKRSRQSQAADYCVSDSLGAFRATASPTPRRPLSNDSIGRSFH